MSPYRNAYDACITGMRRGWDLVIRNMLPNMMLAFVFIQILGKASILEAIGTVCAPVMSIFGLPGEAVTVLMTSWLSIAAGVGTAASLHLSGTLSGEHLLILLPGMYLLAAQIQYMGRLLSVIGIAGRYYPLICGIGCLNAALGMWLMRLAV